MHIIFFSLLGIFNSPICSHISMTSGIQVPSAWHVATSSAIKKAGFVQEYVTVPPGMNMLEVVSGGLLAAFGGGFGGVVQARNLWLILKLNFLKQYWNDKVLFVNLFQTLKPWAIHL